MKTNIVNLGIVTYGRALKIQNLLFEMRQKGEIDNTLLLLEHFPVLTLGTRGNRDNIYIPVKELEEKGVEIFEVNRGGDVTYHGPGQIVGYFIFDLRDFNKDVKQFVLNIELSIINLLKEQFNIDAYSGQGKYTGVWTAEKKITAIGISVSKCITMHGFAFNVNTDLEHFKWINPCGLSMGVTSVEALTGKKQDMAQLFKETQKQIIKQFSLNAENFKINELIKENI